MANDTPQGEVLKGNITVDILAEALRRVADPTVNERLRLQERPDVKQLRRVECQSPSGGRFVAVIADSKTFTDYGRVIALEDYKYPHSDEAEFAGLPTHKAAIFQWGRGANVLLTGQNNIKLPQLTREAKQHLAMSTYIRDLKEYVGNQFQPHIQVADPITSSVVIPTEADLGTKSEPKKK
jgi:hypothetical protein